MLKTRRRKPLHDKEIAYFCHHLAKMLDRGIGLRPGLLLVRDLDMTRWGERIESIVAQLDRGASLGQALQDQQLPALFVSFVTAGEQHNGLVQSLTKCAQFYLQKHRVRQTLGKAFIYPLMVLMLMGVTFVVLITTVLPRFAELYATMGVTLPWYTQMLLAVHHPGLYYGILLGLAMGMSGGIILWHRRKALMQEKAMQLMLRLPFVRQGWQLRFTSVFSWQLGLLLQAGVPLVDAFEMIALSWPWPRGKQVITRIRQRLERGFTLQQSCEPEVRHMFHPLLPQQLAVGEASGSVAETLLHSGEIADEQLEGRIQWLTRVWEPILILGTGGLLALMVLALFVPMFSLAEGL